MIADVGIQPRRPTVSLRMLPKLAARTPQAVGRAARDKVERRIKILLKSIERRPERSSKQIRDAVLADQGRVGRILIRKLLIIPAQVENHLRRNRINRIGGDA